jgi:ABC-2 type transport system ATP-binding protein
VFVSEAPISVQSLEKRYGEREVLLGVDLEVGVGEVVALLGPNGAGKTTTIEILEGYREPSSGQVRVLGFDPWRHPRELRERTGVVLQECGFHDHLRVGETIDAWRAYYPTPRPRAELLEVVELADESRTPVRRLSGGQRRRLDFALALAGDPEVIFLDEPTTGFDPEARRRCWSAIENLAALGKTILLTTHYLDEADRLADRVAVLAGGRIRAVGDARALAQLADTPTSISFQLGADRVSIETRTPSKELQELFRSYGELPDLIVTPPTLEDTYLRLINDDRVPA